MHHNLVWVLWSIGCISLAPVIANRVGKYLSATVECSSRNSTTCSRVALESMLGNSIPKVESTVRTSRAKRAVLRVKGDGVDGIDICHVVLGRVAMAFEGEVRALNVWSVSLFQYHGRVPYAASFSSTY
jgi:hypothetical protein